MTARRRGLARLGQSEPLLVAALLVLAGCGGRSSRPGGRGEASGSEAGSDGASMTPVASGGTAGADAASPAGGGGGTGPRRPTFAPGAPSEVLALIPTQYANLGTTVALSYDTLAVGAPGPAGENSGDQPPGTPVPTPAVLVFRRDDANGEWVEEALLTIPDLPEPDPGSRFGVALALEGDLLVVGAPSQRPRGASDCLEGCGSVHVFERLGPEWEHVVELPPPSHYAGLQYGSALAVSDGTVAIGEPSADSNRGAVDLFENRNGHWQQVRTVQPDQPVQNSGFGSAVALDHETLAVAESERVHVFESDPSSEWILTSDSRTTAGFFGNRIALRGDTLVVAEYAESSNAVGVNGTPGAPYPADGYFSVHSGAAHVFRRDELFGWQKEAFLKSAQPVWEGLFGWDLALDGDTLLVAERQSEGHGAGFVEQENPDDPTSRGAVWVFQREDTTWLLRGALKSPKGETAFASSVGALALTDRFVAVGAFADGPAPADPTVLGIPYAGGVFVWPWSHTTAEP